MNTSATLAHLKSKLFEAQFQATIYHPDPKHTAMWVARRKRLSIAVHKLQARREAQQDRAVCFGDDLHVHPTSIAAKHGR